MKDSKHEKHRRTFRFFSLLLVFIIVPITLTSMAYPQANPNMTLEKTVNSTTPKPGDRINFNINYSNPMTQTAYNVTLFEKMPSDLIFISSRPFYDSVSNPDERFFRWSRGNVAPGEAGTINVSAMVNNVGNGTSITNTVHLTYEYENGTTVEELTSSISIIVAQGAGVDVYPTHEIHSIPPSTGAETNYNITVSNTGNGPDVFDISLSSIAFDKTPAGKLWEIELHNSTGYPISPVATLHDDASIDHSSWSDWGTLDTTVTLETGESTWFMINVVEPGGTCGNGSSYIKVHLTATSQFDSGISDTGKTTTIVRSVAGITFAPDNAMEANPGETITYLHDLYNAGQTEVIDLDYASSQGWKYSFFFTNGTALNDTDNSGYVDVGEIAKDEHLNILVKVTVPYGTAAGIVDKAVITAIGTVTGNDDTANDTTTVKCAPALGVAKKLVSGNPTYEGETVTYQINVTNLGNTKLTRIPLDDAFETVSLNFSSANPGPDSYSEIAGTIHWENLTSLEPLQSTIVTVNFTATFGDDSVKESANVIDAEDQFGNFVSAVYVNTELKVVKLYTLTVTASPLDALGGTFDIVWTERGTVQNATLTTPTQIRCDENTNTTVSNPQDPILKGNVRHVFDSYAPFPTVTIESDMTIVLNYRTQYLVTFTHTGLDSTATGTVVTVNGDPKGFNDLPFTVWVDSGDSINYSYGVIVSSSISGKRFSLANVTGAASPISVSDPVTVTGKYKIQYEVAFDKSGVSADFTGTVVTIDGIEYQVGDLRKPFWWDFKSAHTFVFQSPLVVTTNAKQYVWISTSGLSSLQSGSINVSISGSVVGNYKTRYYLTMSTNFGTVTPSSGWHDAGSTIQISASAPGVVDGEQYLWFGWAGTGSGSYSGMYNPASIMVNSAIVETAHWKIVPELTIFVSNETVASCDRIVVYGRTFPFNSGTQVGLTYIFPDGTQITDTVQTDGEGRYKDVLLLREESLYGLFDQGGEWLITANRLGDINQEAVTSTATLEIEAPVLFQTHPAILAGLIVVVVTITYVFISKRVKSKKITDRSWWRATVILGMSGLVFGAGSLVLNWVSVDAATTVNGQTYLVDISLRPFHSGLVSITEMLQYAGAEIPSLVDSAWWGIPKGPGSVSTLYLLPIGCILTLVSLYKPSTERRRKIKMVALIIAGVLILIPVAHSLMFVVAHANTFVGASTGYGIGIYIAIVGGLLAVLSGLFARRETLIARAEVA